jgi:hypothetical protein
LGIEVGIHWINDNWIPQSVIFILSSIQYLFPSE